MYYNVLTYCLNTILHVSTRGNPHITMSNSVTQLLFTKAQIMRLPLR